MGKFLLIFVICRTVFLGKKDSPLICSANDDGNAALLGPSNRWWGLNCLTNANEFLLFKNEFPDYYPEYLYYLEYIDVHTRLTFIDKG